MSTTTGKATTETTSPDYQEASGLDDQQAKMLEKIRGLLKQAEHKGTGPTEAEAFTAMATKLMHKYRLDREMIELGRSKVVDLGTVLRRGVHIVSPYAKESTGLLCSVAAHFNCRVILETTSFSSGVWAAVYGIDSDPELVEMLFTSLRIQATAGMLAAKPKREKEHLGTFRSGWFRGFITALDQRFADIRRSALIAEHTVRTGPAELALRKRIDTVNAYIAEKYPRLDSVRPDKVSGSGVNDGYRSGQIADIGTGSVGGSGTTRRTRALPS